MKTQALFSFLVCISSLLIGQTYTPIDRIDWANQAGTSGTTISGSTWDAQGNDAKNCDTTGQFGPTLTGFVIDDWEGTCGCDCEPSDPDPKCGATDVSLTVDLAPAQLVSYCMTRVSFSVSGSGTLRCGTNDNLSAADYTPGQCNDDLGDWENTDFLHIVYTVIESDGTVRQLEERICGTQGLGTFERVFDDAIDIEISFVGGTQDGGAYTISNISVEGVINEILGYQVFASNTNNGEICENSTLPLILQTNATAGQQFVWSGPNNFVSNQKVIVFSNLTTNLSGIYNVQVTDANGCMEERQISVNVLPSNDAGCVKRLEFASLNGIICSSDALPGQSDNGVSGTWSPSPDLSIHAGQVVDFTFTPDDVSYQNFEITVQVDDAQALDQFAIQPDPIPIFCNGDATTYDLIDIFQMDLSLALTINGEEDIFDFIQNNELIQNAEADMRSISFLGVTPGEKVFFLEGTSTCGVNRKAFRFYVAPSTDPIVIDTALCSGDYLEYYGHRITKDTIINPGSCGGSVEFKISRKSPGVNRRWIQQSVCASRYEAFYFYDTIINGRYVGFTTDYLGENYFAKIQDGWLGPFVLPIPAANGCDSTINVSLTSTRNTVGVIERELCAYESASFTVIDAQGRSFELNVNSRRLEQEVAFNCDSAVVLRMVVKPTQLDTFTGVYCHDETPSIEVEPGRFITFNKNYTQDEFTITGTGNGCEGRAYVDLTFRDEPFSIYDEQICPGESVIIGSEVITENTNRDIVLVGMGAGGCDSVVTVNIEVLDATISSDVISCNRPNVQLVATHNGVGVQNWISPDGSIINETTPSVSVPGRYRAVIESRNGCTSEFAHIVEVDDTPPTLSANGGTITCSNGNQVQLSASTDGTIISWTGDNGFFSSDPAPVVTQGGRYTVLTRADNGCESMQEVEVIQDDTPPTLTVDAPVITCTDPTVQLLTTTDADDVSWSGAGGFSSTEVSPMISSPGDYTITATAANGCETTQTITVVEDTDLPEITVADIVLDCNTPQANLVATSISTIVEWTGDNGFSSNEESPMISDPGTYTVLVRGANGCEDTRQVVVSLDDAEPTASADDITLDCNTTDASLIVTTDGTVESWTADNGFASNEVSPSIDAAGVYTANIRGANGCTTTIDINVNMDDTSPTAEAIGGIITCANNEEITLSANTNGTIVGWTGPNGFSSNEATPTISAAGEYTITVRGDNGCEATDEVTVLVDKAPPALSVSSPVIDCNNPDVQLTTITDGVSASWTGVGGFTSTDINPVISTPGDYTVTITGANGCTSAETITVIEDIALPDVTADDLVLSCNVTQVNLLANSTATVVEWTGANGFQSNEASPLITDPGVYTVRVMGNNGCENTAQMTVDLDDVEPVSTADDIVLDCNTTEAALIVATDGAVESWTSDIGFTSSDESPMINAAGRYTALIRGSNGCTSTIDIGVTLDDTPPMLEPQGGIITCADNGEITLSANTDGTIIDWVGDNGFVSGDASPTITLPGTYTVTAEGANGCITTADITITEDVTTPALAVVPGVLDCAHPEVQLVTTTDAVSASWTGANGYSSTEISPMVTATGDYTVTVTGANGCTETMTVTVTEDLTPPDVIADDLVLDCNVTQVNLVATSSATVVEWTGDNGFSSTEESPTVSEPGTYIVRVVADNGCDMITELVVSLDDAAPMATADDLLLDCSTTEAALLVTTDGTVESWTSDIGFTSAEAAPMVSAAGLYTALVRGANGCTMTIDVDVTIDDVLPTVTADDQSFSCAAPEAQLSATTDGIILGWTGVGGFSSAEESPMVSVAGDYEVTVQGANGCTTTETITVTGDVDIPSLSVTDAVLDCNNEMISLIANTDGTVISWEGVDVSYSSTEASPMVSLPGRYEVTVEAANGCTNSMVLEITEDKVQPSVTSFGGELTCDPSSSVMLDYDSEGTFLRWEGPDGFSSTETTPSVKVLGDYTVYVQGANGCINSTSATVTGSIDIPTATASSSAVLTCDVIETRLSAASATATVVEWQTPDGAVITDASPLVTVPGTYTVTVSSAAGCLGYASVEVLENVAPPAAQLSAGVLDCVNSTVSLTATTSDDIRGWRGPDGYTSLEDSPSISAAGLYIVEIQGANGCVLFDSIMVMENIDAPDVTLAIDGTPSCASSGAVLQVTTTGQVTGWAGPSGFSGSADRETVYEAGEYEVTVLGANGCVATEKIEVQFDEAQISIGQIIGSCVGVANGSFELNVANATPPFTLSGVGADRQISSLTQMIDGINAGNYNITITDANGCSTTSSVSIDDDRSESVTIDIEITNPIGEYDLDLDFTGDVSEIVWDDKPGLSCYDCANPSVKLTENTTYTVTVIDPEGCRATTEVYLTLNDIGTIYLPNIVRLSSRKGNDLFYPQAVTGERVTYDMSIYDRWGNRVYIVNNAPINEKSHGWDGRMKGNEVASGVYVYHIVFKNEFGAEKVLKGDVTFVK